MGEEFCTQLLNHLSKGLSKNNSVMKEKPVVGWAMPTLLQKCEFVFGRSLTP
jgi:hypothetical protein